MNIKKVNKWSDNECLAVLQVLLSGRVTLGTSYISNKEGILTHQRLSATCGDSVIESEPEELPMALAPLPLCKSEVA